MNPYPAEYIYLRTLDIKSYQLNQFITMSQVLNRNSVDPDCFQQKIHFGLVLIGFKSVCIERLKFSSTCQSIYILKQIKQSE